MSSTTQTAARLPAGSPATPAPSTAPNPIMTNAAQVAKAMKILPPISTSKNALDQISTISGVPGAVVPRDNNPSLGSMRNCDPKLYDDFYQNSLLTICNLTKLAYCPWYPRDYAKKIALSGGELGLTAMIVGSGRYIEAWWDNSKKKEAITEALREVKSSTRHLSTSEEVWEREGLKDLLTREKADKESLTKLLGVLQKDFPEAEGKDLVVGALRALPVSLLDKQLARRALVAGVLGAVAFKASGVIGFMADSSPVACEGQTDRVMTLDPDSYCAPKFDLSSQVLNFLNLSPEDRQRFLSNPKVCAYYTKFNEILKDRSNDPPPTNIQCTAHGSSYDVTLRKDEASPELTYHIDVDADDKGESKTMHASLTGNASQPSFMVGNFNIDFYDENGLPSFRDVRYNPVRGGQVVANQETRVDWNDLSRDLPFYSTTYASKNYFPIFRQALRRHKLFQPLVQYCCAIKDDGARGKCTHTLGTIAKGTKYIDLENAVAPPPPPPPPATAAPAAK